MRIAATLYVLSLLALVAFVDAGLLSGMVVWLHDVPAGDKLGHLFFALFLGLLVERAMRGRTLAVGPLRVPRSLVWLVPIVLAEEVSQLFVRGRTFDLLDLAADGLGLFVGAWLGSRPWLGARRARASQPPASAATTSAS